MLEVELSFRHSKRNRHVRVLSNIVGHIYGVELEVEPNYLLPAKVAADNAVPSWVVLRIKILLDVRGNILFNCAFFQGQGSSIYCILLHLLGHIGTLDHSLADSHA